MTCEAYTDGKHRCGAAATQSKVRRDPAIAFPWLDPQPVDWDGPPFQLCEAHWAASFAPPKAY